MYERHTKYFHLPYISEGEELSGESERIAATIIDNELLAATGGMTKCLIEDGDYDVFDNGDGTYTLVLKKLGDFSVIGILNRRLFLCEENIYNDCLAAGNLYYFYACYSDSMETDPTSFTREATTDPKADSPYTILLCMVDLRGDAPVVIDDMDDKVYTKNILAHGSDCSNPHGRTLYQDNLVINDTLKIEDRSVYSSETRSVELPGNSDCVVLSFGADVAFVSVMPLEQGIGSWWCEMSGKEARIYSDGSRCRCRVKADFA